MNLMLRRRLLYAKPKIDTPYISSGLVFWLDGIDKGEKQGYWTDLVGRIEFELVNGVSFSDTSVDFSENNEGLRNDNISKRPFTYDDHTIECCFEPNATGNTVILLTRVNNSPVKQVALGYVSGNTLLTCGVGSTGQTYNFSIQKSTISSAAGVAVQNLQQLSVKGTDYFGGYSSYFSIGGRINGSNINQNIFTGSIYSIRIYNRLLSYDEMIYNQKVDNIRFNLGLTI